MTLSGLYVRLRFGMPVGEAREALSMAGDIADWGLEYHAWFVRMRHPGRFVEAARRAERWGMEELDRVQGMALNDILKREV